MAVTTSIIVPLIILTIIFIVLIIIASIILSELNRVDSSCKTDTHLRHAHKSAAWVLGLSVVGIVFAWVIGIIYMVHFNKNA